MASSETDLSDSSRTDFSFAYEPASSWPSLAWLAICEPGAKSIRVIHGAGLECHKQWFCEAVWDAAFPEGEFDRTDLVFGSGGRLREREIIFVSPGSTVDRLQWAVRDNRTFISNSLPCLLEAIGAVLDASFRGYGDLFHQIVHGIDQDFPDLPIVGGRVRFTYFHNLVWNGSEIGTAPKPDPQRDFGTFESYTGFVSSALQRIADNMASRARKQPLDWLGTISRGYDAATCTALACSAGLKRVLTYDESQPGISDDGSEIARRLKLQPVVVNRSAWKAQRSAEALFLAADGWGKEVALAGTPVNLHGHVLITGHGGDNGWAMTFKSAGLPPNSSVEPSLQSLVRGSFSGLSMTEYRLHAGFIHLPLPFMGLRQLPDLLKLSNSSEMAQWDIGGDYNRPICRRVLQQAGVARDMFGTWKTGPAIRFLRGEDAWSPTGKRSFLRWLRKHRTDYGISLPTLLELRGLLRALDIVFETRVRRRGWIRKKAHGIGFRLAARIKAMGMNDLAFVWAIDTVRKSYRQ
jgi:hypothetical protein